MNDRRGARSDCRSAFATQMTAESEDTNSLLVRLQEMINLHRSARERGSSQLSRGSEEFEQRVGYFCYQTMTWDQTAWQVGLAPLSNTNGVRKDCT